MNQKCERVAWIFDVLAVLLLDEVNRGQTALPTSRVERTLQALQRMSAEEWKQLLQFAGLQRARLRTLLALEHWNQSGVIRSDAQRFGDLRGAEERKNLLAMSTLQMVVAALELTGHSPIVIKTLDHWPDIGSDLDLFVSANEADTIRIMQGELNAEVEKQSWGDRLAHKWNFRVPGLEQLVEVHVGRLGQTGEHCVLSTHLERTSAIRETGPYQFRVPAPEEQVILATLQRMYRHFYIRLTDVLNLSSLVRESRLDFARLRQAAIRFAIWPGVATLLRIASDYNEHAGFGALPLPGFVFDEACFGANVLYMGEQFLRVPMMPQGAQLFLRQFVGTGTNLDFQALARLSLFPLLAGAAFLNLRLTGNDKGIW